MLVPLLSDICVACMVQIIRLLRLQAKKGTVISCVFQGVLSHLLSAPTVAVCVCAIGSFTMLTEAGNHMYLLCDVL